MPDFDPILLPRLSKYLTSNLLDTLSDSSAVTLATQRLNSLHKALSSYLPQYIVDREELLKQDYGSLTPGTFMFADVSGFTALSETLMTRVGLEGIEVLTHVINDYFTIMLEILAKSEGHLLKFAGDAMLTFFPAETDRDEFPKAVNTALRMQRAMRENFQPISNAELTRWFGAHDMELSMSIGVCSGKLFEALVGNIAQRDHMIMGRLPGSAMAAEEAGERDDVIIPVALREAYADVFETIPTSSDGFYQVVDNFGDRLGDYEFSMPQRRRAKSAFLFSFDTENLFKDLENELVRVETISRFVSSEIVNKLVVKGDHIDSENRLATVIFVHFTGFAELLEVWGEKNLDILTVILSRYYGIMQRVIATNGGVLTRSDPYKLGSKLLITFGAPIAHPDDPDRAVATALEMNRQLEIFNKRLKEELPQFADWYPIVKQRMGITQGRVYAGEVGWRQRREYTVMGDDVNLAARLMAKAEFGQVIVSQTIWQRVNAYFETEALPPFRAKGKAALVHSYVVKGAARTSMARTSDTPFIGRELSLLSLNLALQEALNAPQKPKALALQGDVGVGKTRLAMEFARSATDSGFTVVWATCHSHNTRKTTWASIVTHLLNIDPHDGQQDLKARLSEWELSDLEDVLGDLIFSSAENRATPAKASSQTRDDLFKKLANDSTINMNKDELALFRKHMKKALNAAHTDLSLWYDLEHGTGLTDALMRFLSAYTRQKPLLLVIDDLHKENSRAINILKRIVNELSAARLMILVTYEPAHHLDIPMEKVAIADLPEEQTYLMVTAILNASELGSRLSKFIWDSTNGRALFIESLMQALVDNDHLIEDQGVVELKTNAEALPNNIRGLIISRIDRLSTQTRILLRAAAILEDNFSAEALDFVSELNNPGLVSRILDELTQLQILEPTEAAHFYRFRHGVTQQALYEELTRLQRQGFHQQAAAYYAQQEQTENTILDRVHHLLKAGAGADAVNMLSESAERAEQNQDIGQALELYSKALEIQPDNITLQGHMQRLQQV